MKSVAAVLFATASFLSAQQFQTGQAARLVIGQTTFTRQVPGASAAQLGAVSGLALVNDTLFAVDSSRVPASPQNHRVLVYPQVSSQLPAAKASMPWDGVVRCPVCGGFAANVIGQKDFTSNKIGIGADQFRNPTAVASDGQVLAVADTDNNRVLIWFAIPTADGQAANVVIGQGDFTTVASNFGGTIDTPSAKGLRGPQGVWIQNGRLYIADTQNNRVLIYNSIPRQNGASADAVLGAPDFSTFVQSDLAQATLKATASNMLNPVSVTSDGTRLFVTDLGHNRVLIWNSIPTRNATPVDVVVGQPDVESNETNLAFTANNSPRLCDATGTGTDGNPTYPERCAATLNFPRFAISDGTRLFVADGGNDRVLVFNTIPNANGVKADVVLGQGSATVNQDSEPLKISAADSLRTPASLAWDGTNLYVSDPFNRRIVVFTPGDQPLLPTGVRNAASREIFALGGVTFSAQPKENDEVTIKIGEIEYKYKAVANDTIEDVIQGLVAAINAGAGDPLVLATPNLQFAQLLLTARASGETGNGLTFTVTFSTGAQLAGAAGGPLTGGQDAARIAPGSLISIIGDNLSDVVASAPAGATDLPQTLGNVEVYIDGIRAPLMYVSPTQINSQMPWEVNDSSSVSVYVRKVDRNNQTRITTAIAVPIIPQNPGIFALTDSGPDPRPARALHAGSFASGVVSVDGSIKAADVATVTIEDRPYAYTVKAEDTLISVRQALIDAINQDEKVSAVASGIFTRIVLRAKVPGPDGEGITYSANANAGANLIVSALTSSLCCASRENAPITEADPARPGEIITIYATGLGIVAPDEAKGAQVTGSIYRGPADNYPNTPVDDAQAGAKTANVLFSRLIPGTVGLYEVQLQLNSDIPTNPQTQLYIAQQGFISNVVSFAIVNPATPTEPAP